MSLGSFVPPFFPHPDPCWDLSCILDVVCTCCTIRTIPMKDMSLPTSERTDRAVGLLSTSTNEDEDKERVRKERIDVPSDPHKSDDSIEPYVLSPCFFSLSPARTMDTAHVFHPCHVLSIVNKGACNFTSFDALYLNLIHFSYNNHKDDLSYASIARRRHQQAKHLIFLRSGSLSVHGPPATAPFL